MENSTAKEENSIRNPLMYIIASNSWQSKSPKFPKNCLKKRFISIIEMVFRRNYRFVFLHEGHNQQP